jgi:hypothetical protein
MAEDTLDDTALRLKLNVRLGILDPQIQGLTKLVSLGVIPQLGMSPDLLLKIREQLAAATKRQSLIENVLSILNALQAALAALDADGFPSFPAIPLEPALFNELLGDSGDIDAAVGLFSSPLTVKFDNSVVPIDVPQPVPPQ